MNEKWAGCDRKHWFWKFLNFVLEASEFFLLKKTSFKILGEEQGKVDLQI